jgi:lysophospholipid acyltransferase (LPLAT)-like uncharacterized protein
VQSRLTQREEVTLYAPPLREILKPIKVYLAGGLAAFIIAVLARLVRWSCEIPKGVAERNDSLVISFWHGRLIMMPYLYLSLRGGRKQPPYMLISQHGDGRIIALACKLLGIRSVAGSSSRGGLRALRELLKLAENGSDIGFTPDGPRGPRYEVKEGVVAAAIKSGYEVLPCTYSAEKRWVLGSWDGMIIPKPFSRGVFIVGLPIKINPNDDPEMARLTIQSALNELTERADKYWDPP